MFLIKIVPQYNSLIYPVFPTTPAGRSLPANKLCSICYIRAAGFVCFPINKLRTAAMVASVWTRRPSEKNRSDTRIRQPRFAKISGSRTRPTLLIMSLRPSENDKSDFMATSLFSDDLSPILSQEEPVIRQLAAQEFWVELHQDFVKLQNLVLHFAAFGYRQPRAVQAHD